MADCLNNQQVPGQVKIFDPNLFSSPPQKDSNQYNNFNLGGAVTINDHQDTWTNSSLEQQWNLGGNLSNDSVQENNVSGEQSYPSQNYGDNDNSSVELAFELAESESQQWQATPSNDSVKENNVSGEQSDPLYEKMADCLNNQQVPGEVKMFDPNLFSSQPQQDSDQYNNFNLGGTVSANGFDPDTWTNSLLEQQWNLGGNLSNNSVKENNANGEQSYPSQNYGDKDNSSVELAESSQQWQASPSNDSVKENNVSGEQSYPSQNYGDKDNSSVELAESSQQWQASPSNDSVKENNVSGEQSYPSQNYGDKDNSSVELAESSQQWQASPSNDSVKENNVSGEQSDPLYEKMADCLNNQQVPGEVKMFDPNLFSSQPQQDSNQYNNFNLGGAVSANGFDPDTWTNSLLEQQWNLGGNLSNNSVQENNANGEQSYPSQNYGDNDNSSVELAESSQQWQASPSNDSVKENNVSGEQSYPSQNYSDKDNSSVELAARETLKQQWAAQPAADWQSPQQCQAHTEAASPQTTHPNVYTSAPNVVATTSSLIRHLRNLNYRPRDEPHFCHEVTGLDSQQQFPPASGMFNTTHPSLVTDISPTAEAKTTFCPVSVSIDTAGITPSRSEMAPTVVEQIPPPENPVLTGMNPVPSGINTEATSPSGVILTNFHHTQSDTSAEFNQTTDRGYTYYQPHTANVLSADHQPHSANVLSADHLQNSLSCPAVPAAVVSQQQHTSHPNDDRRSQVYDRDNRYRPGQSRNRNHRDNQRSQNRWHGYMDDPYRLQSRQDYYGDSNGANDYYSTIDLYMHGNKDRMRAYQQYQYDSSQQQQQQQGSYAVPPGFYDQYGHYYARSKSYDSNSSYYSSHHSPSRGSTPVNQYLKESNNFRPSNRQCPIDSVDLGQQQVPPTLPEPQPAIPPRYTLPDVKASFMPGGNLVEVQPSRPQDGQQASGAKELKAFPGPLSRNETLIDDVVRFCQDQVKQITRVVGMIDKESASLLWRYLELLIKQNGIVLGSNISDLLMEGHTNPKIKQNLPIIGSNAPMDIVTAAHDTDLHHRITADRSMVSPKSGAALDRFRYLCMFGRKKEALEFAMKSNLWEQALLLAIAMGPMISASVRTRFMDSTLRSNDPLTTFYQMLSGRQPAACTMVGDEQFGDWRPHLAVILSQATERTDNQTIMDIGDAFATKGNIFASHFCYIMANYDFQNSSEETAKLVLLGSNHKLPLQEHATNLSIQMTEILEYGMSLAKPNFCIPALQTYKLLYISRLVDAGLPEKALSYCRILSGTILQSAASYPKSLVQGVAEFGHRLKTFDPARQFLEEKLPDPTWLQKIQALSRQYESGALQFAPTSGSETPATANTSSTIEVRQQMQNVDIGQDNQGTRDPHQYNVSQPGGRDIPHFSNPMGGRDMIQFNQQSAGREMGEFNNASQFSIPGSAPGQQEPVQFTSENLPFGSMGKMNISSSMLVNGADDQSELSEFAASGCVMDKKDCDKDINRIHQMRQEYGGSVTPSKEIEERGIPANGTRDPHQYNVSQHGGCDIPHFSNPMGGRDMIQFNQQSAGREMGEFNNPSQFSIPGSAPGQQKPVQFTSENLPFGSMGKMNISSSILVNGADDQSELSEFAASGCIMDKKDCDKDINRIHQMRQEYGGSVTPSKEIEERGIPANGTRDPHQYNVSQHGGCDIPHFSNPMGGRDMIQFNQQSAGREMGEFNNPSQFSIPGSAPGQQEPVQLTSENLPFGSMGKMNISSSMLVNGADDQSELSEFAASGCVMDKKDCDKDINRIHQMRQEYGGSVTPSKEIEERGIPANEKLPQEERYLATGESYSQQETNNFDGPAKQNFMSKLQSRGAWLFKWIFGKSDEPNEMKSPVDEKPTYNQYQQSPANQLMYQPQSAAAYGTPPAAAGYPSEWQQPPVDAVAPPTPQPMQFFNPSDFQQPIVL